MFLRVYFLPDGRNDALNSKGLRPAQPEVVNGDVQSQRCPEFKGIKTHGVGDSVKHNICRNDALNSKGLRLFRPSYIRHKAWGRNDALNSKGLRPCKVLWSAVQLCRNDALNSKGLRPVPFDVVLLVASRNDALNSKGLRLVILCVLTPSFQSQRCPEFKGIKTAVSSMLY